jgi:FkbM family methyltransferase
MSSLSHAPSSRAGKPDVDYSQSGEQAAILDAFEGRAPGRFLDIGAWDPFKFSNTRALFERGWSGVLIEPSPGPMRKLLDEYGQEPRITLIQAAVTMGYSKTLIKFEISDDAYSTNLPEQFERYQFAEFIGKLFVPTIGLAQIGNLFGVPDFISIDAEGNSADLFLQMLRLGWRPRCVCVEWDARQEEITSAAVELGYTLAFATPENGVFVFGREGSA